MITQNLKEFCNLIWSLALVNLAFFSSGCAKVPFVCVHVSDTA